MALEHKFVAIPRVHSEALIVLRNQYSFPKTIIRYNCQMLDAIPWPTGKFADNIEKELAALRKWYQNNSNNSANIHDDYILPNMSAFELMDTYIDGIIPFRGLNYYGYTLIPYETIPKFIQILRQYEENTVFSAIESICENALALQEDILHIGI